MCLLATILDSVVPDDGTLRDFLRLTLSFNIVSAFINVLRIFDNNLYF